LSYVYAAVEQVALKLSGYAVVVTKSTVPVGTGRRITEIIRQGSSGSRIRRRLKSRVLA
jgi:UDPglucose 6-dehydrogenase